MSDLVITHDNQDSPYILLTPSKHIPRASSFSSARDIEEVITSFQSSRILAVDFETVGADYSHGSIQIVGMGLAWDSRVTYFDWAKLTKHQQVKLLDAVAQHPGTIAHNIYFDGGVLLTNLGIQANWMCDTYSLLAMTANEGYPGRSWGLKKAQAELLLWTETNEVALDRWLCSNKHYVGNPRKDESPEVLGRLHDEGSLRADKSKMHLAPSDILGHYCCLDAESCYLLFTEILEPAASKYPGFMEFVCGPYMKLITLHIEQKLVGLPVDVSGLQDRRTHLIGEMDQCETSFLIHPDVSPHILDMENDLRKSYRAREPLKCKKDGRPSKIYAKWKDKLDSIERDEVPEYNFNLQSGIQLAKLLYDKMQYECVLQTEKGLPATSIKALKKMGDVGVILIDRNYMLKEIGFIEKYLELAAESATKSSIHPSFRLPGASTGRSSSKEPNLQQIPKSKAVMGLFHARPGMVWVDADFSALEPTLTAEFSQDDNMLFLYGSNAKPNDIYLFIGAQVPGMGEKIKKTGYDPYNPTYETITRAKKECKHERNLCKTVCLAAVYGAGIKKIQAVLEADNIFMSYEEVQAIHQGYWNTFAGVKDFGRGLMFQWKRNGGYILNGLGRPMAVPEEMTQDLLNRFIQSSGHDVLTIFVSILSRRLDESGIEWYPLIMDFHDATTVEVPEDRAGEVVVIFNQAMDELNQELNGTVKLKGNPVVGRTLADVKEPEE